MAFIEAKDVFFSYKANSEEICVLSGLSLSIEEGSFIAITGPDGSGKSTFAKLLNALLKPNSGTVFVNGADTCDSANTEAIRKTVGLVFQNPDNQIIGDTVEDDVAFGPENLGLSSEEINSRVTMALAKTGITDLRFRDPHKLSGGQKQKVAVAGVLAMNCRCIVLDEATSMLDSESRKELLENLHKLNKEQKTTVILITHRLDECKDCDNIYIMDGGKITEKKC